MRRGRKLMVAAVAASLLGAPPFYGAQAAQVTDQTDNLDIFAEFFLPSSAITQVLLGGCETAYRTKLSNDPDDRVLEQQIPGIHDRMVEAAANYCRGAASNLTSRRHAAIRAYWVANATAPEIARLAQLFAIPVNEVRRMSVTFREGDMATDAARRAASSEAGERFQRAQVEFAQTPGGTALLNRVGSFQADQATSMEPEIAGFMRSALAEAHRAANDYARERGFAPPYGAE